MEGIPRDQLMRDVEAFVEEKGLQEHVAYFRKGALIAQNPACFEDIDGPEALDETEKTILRDEILHKWRLPWRLYLTIITCSIGAAVQGWDQTGSNGATLFFPKYYGIDGTSARDNIVSLGAQPKTSTSHVYNTNSSISSLVLSTLVLISVLPLSVAGYLTPSTTGLAAEAPFS